MEPQEYDEIIRQLVRIAAHQDTIIDDLRAFNRQQLEINRQQVEINADVKTTLARIETLLARMIRYEENGRAA